MAFDTSKSYFRHKYFKRFTMTTHQITTL